MDVKEKTKMESSSLVICEHFSGTNIFLTNGIVPRIHIKILKSACEGTLISFHHLLIVQMGKLMFIEGKWFSQDNPAAQHFEVILLTPSP